MLDAWIIGLHLATAHSGGEIPLESVTPGVYAKAPSGWAVGAYRNSFKRASVWGGHVFETADKRWALTVGVVTGYTREEGQRFCRPGFISLPGNPCYHGDKAALRALVAPSVRIPINSSTAMRLAYMPKVGDGAHALHMSLEF